MIFWTFRMVDSPGRLTGERFLSAVPCCCQARTRTWAGGYRLSSRSVPLRTRQTAEVIYRSFEHFLQSAK